MDLVKSSLKVFLARLVMALANFSAVVIFSRELGASPLGTYYPFLALLGIIAIPSDFGLRQATEKRISEGQDAGTYLGAAIALKFPPLLLMISVVLLAGPYINQYLGANLVLPLVVAIIIQEAARLSLFVLRGELRVGETAIAQVLRPVGWLTAGFLLYSLGYGVHGLVYGYIAGSAAMMIVGWARVSTKPTRPKLRHARSLLNYSRYSVISAVGGYFYSWMDVAILTLFVVTGVTGTRAGIGAYENAWRVSLIVMLFSRAIAMTLFPQISQWDAKDATDRIEAVIPTAILPALIISIPAFVGSVFLAKDILRVLFAPEFTVAWLALIVLTGEKILQAIHIVLGRCLQAIDRPDLAAYATIAAVLINFVLNVILIWQFGLVGAAIATAISFAANTALHAYYLNQFIDIKLPLREGFWSIVSASVMGLTVHFTQSVVDIHTAPELVGVIMFGAIVYAFSMLAYHPFRKKVWTMVGPVVTKRIP